MTNPFFISATFRTCFFSPISGFMMKRLKCKYYNRRITTRDSGNVQYHDQEESKLNSTINVNNDAHTLTDDKIIISRFNKKNLGTIKSKEISNKDVITGAYRIGNSDIDVMLLFKNGLSLIVNKLFFSLSKNFLLTRVRILKSP